MDSSDIYYSDNSQLIDSNNTEWINNTVLVENEEISWHDTGHEITVDYSESATNIDNTLNNTGGYETADPGDNTETSQYFSILESTITENDNTIEEEQPKCVLNVEVDKEETILPDISGNTESEIEELNLDDKISENEVILYRPAGSEELYAVQIAEDEHGNLQKYKFKVKQNEDGQFEAIPGTMEVENANDMSTEGEIVNENNQDFENFDQEKDNSMILSNATTTNEGEAFEFMNDENEENSDMEIDYLESKHLASSDSVNNTSYEQDQDEEYQTVEGVHVTGDSDTNSRNDYDFTVSNINERTEEDSEEEYEVEELEEAFQDDNTNDAYEDGMTHMENILNSEIRECHTTSVLQHKANISNLKIPIIEPENIKHNVTIYKDDKHLSYLVIKGKEKENVLLDRKTKFNTINMRSILKCNNPSFVPEKCPPAKVEKPQHSVPSIISNKDSHMKPKPKDKPEIVSPVKSKSARQPRKQSLNPVNRVGSEIIVQPLVYPVNEIDENRIITPSKHKRILPEVLQVSDDSDPEFVLKPPARKKKRGRPKKRQSSVEITILDSDEEEKSETNSVIEVRSDQESKGETDNENEKEKEKQKEKNNKSEKDSVTSKDVNVDKVEKKSSPFKKNKCPLCPKTFPRALTLKRHINMHNVRKSLRSTNKQNVSSVENKEVNNKQNENTKVSETATKDKPLAYNCKKCKLKFLLESQYKRHQTIHVSKKPVDKLNVINKKLTPRKKTIEKQVLSGARYLRSNSKMLNEKPVSASSEKKIKVNKATKNKFKCEYCGQLYSTRTLLFSHRSTHKTFPCPNCKTTFTAKILLDDHLRKNCVKSPMKAHVRQSVTKKAIYKKPFVKCEKCNRSFPNQKSLQIHNSVSHRRRSYNTSPGKVPADISGKEMNLLASNKMPHGGVPMSLKLQQAFDKMKQKT